MYMKDYVDQLDSVLSSGGRQLLEGAGTVSHEQAMEKAETEYRKYQEQTISPVEAAYLETIQTAEKAAKVGTGKAVKNNRKSSQSAFAPETGV